MEVGDKEQLGKDVMGAIIELASDEDLFSDERVDSVLRDAGFIPEEITEEDIVAASKIVQFIRNGLEHWDPVEVQVNIVDLEMALHLKASKQS